ncbi:MAG: helix-hairpin-helix domain-containing protein [Isosphaeraceae bacterium]
MDPDAGLRPETSVQCPRFLPRSRGIPVLLCLVAAALAISGPRSADRDGTWADYRAELDVNSATPGQLEVLPRIGPKLAERIAEGRGNRPYRSMADMERRVRGIGPITASQLAPHVRFGLVAAPSPGEASP